MRTRPAVLLGVIAALVAVPQASAATTEIGAVSEINANAAPNPLTAGGYTVQVATAGGNAYAVPSGYGVITSWRHRTGSASGSLTFKVYRPLTDPPSEFTVIGADLRAVTNGQTHKFDVRIPVRPGDLLGLSSDHVEEAYTDTAGPSDLFGTFGLFPVPDPAVGSTASLIAPPASGARLDVAAVVETDADADGYGDDTQDLCPTDATTQAACGGGAPDTRLDKKPRKKVTTTKAKAKVKFAFSSTEAGSTFECAIDKKPFATCTSPVTKRFKPGKRKFQVRAVDADGNVDGTPAAASFKVKRVEG